MRLISEKATAEELGVSVRTLQRWRETGGGPVYIQIGRNVRYDIADIDAWIEAKKRREADGGEA